MKTRQQEQTEGHGREALRLMKELAKSRDPVVRKSCLKAIRESHGDMLDSFRDEVLDAVGEGQMSNFTEIVANDKILGPVNLASLRVVRTDELSEDQTKRVAAYMMSQGLEVPCIVPDEVIDGTKQEFEVAAGFNGGPLTVRPDGMVAKPKRHPNEDDVNFLASEIVDEVEEFLGLKIDTEEEDRLLDRITDILGERLDPDDRPDSAYN